MSVIEGVGRSGLVFMSPQHMGYFARYKDVKNGPFATREEAYTELDRLTLEYEAPALVPEPPADPMFAQLEHWFTYHTPSPEQVACMAEIRAQAKGLAKAIVSLCPPSADRTTAIRHIRDAVMTANASIVLGGK